MALALVGMPLEKLPVSVIRKILEGGESVCAQAGIPVAGGHSIDTLEPIYGLVALGLVHPDKVKRNSAAKPGDVLILGKPLGIGILSAALKKGKLSEAGYAQMIEWTTKLNTPGEALGGDVRRARAHRRHRLRPRRPPARDLPRLEARRRAEIRFACRSSREALDWAKQGVATGASDRNWKGYGHEVEFQRRGLEAKLLTDPQTSGGLLVACAAGSRDAVLAESSRSAASREARVIGRLSAGTAPGS